MERLEPIGVGEWREFYRPLFDEDALRFAERWGSLVLAFAGHWTFITAEEARVFAGAAQLKVVFPPHWDAESAAAAFAYASQLEDDVIVHAFDEAQYAAAVSRLGALVMGRACSYAADACKEGYTLRVLGWENWSVTVRRHFGEGWECVYDENAQDGAVRSHEAA